MCGCCDNARGPHLSCDPPAGFTHARLASNIGSPKQPFLHEHTGVNRWGVRSRARKQLRHKLIMSNVRLLDIMALSIKLLRRNRFQLTRYL